MTEIGAVVDGKYEILKEIGRGGMSIVYLAMDRRLNKQWAVKEIRKKGSGTNDEIVVNSLLAEANMMKKLDHPALPRIVDIIDNGVTIYVVMDYIEGESLDKIINEYGAQSEELVIGWAKQICDALSYLHAQRPPIVYRDMKPANVMLKPEGNIKIIDFGIAREYKEQNLADTTVLGTKGYAPPEQYSGQTDPRSDIFALGMTMHHLLTGVDPRNGEPYAPVRQWNPELSEGIEAIIDKCTQPASENRYQSCMEMLYDLEHPELIGKGFKRKQRQKLGTFCAVAGLSVLLLGAGLVCDRLAVRENNSTYESLVSSVDNIDNYREAIGLYPDRVDAYMRMVETYKSQDEFDKEDSKVLDAVYPHMEKLDPSDAETANLYYEAGLLYYTFYSPGDMSEERLQIERVNKAYRYFDAIHNNEELSSDFEYKALSDCYYQLCAFYKEYVTGSSVREASRSDYENLINTVQSAMADLSDAGQYDKLAMYNGVFVLLHDQRTSMALSGLNQDQVVTLFDNVYQEAMSLKPQKDAAKKLKEMIEEYYEDWRADIVLAYNNAEGRE